ncbi:fungal hydrophobin-domain-containing protein [Infundibulicybe gibba]|nr:fungal hydrophobin-domain-containing protein [Infundibulicybe gibba]
MFSRLATAFIYVFLTVTILAAAKPWGAPPTTTAQPPPPPVTVTVTQLRLAPVPLYSPNEPMQHRLHSMLQLCSADSSAVGLLAGLLGIVLGPITGLVGLTCSPLSVIGIGGNSCSAQPVCCTGNSFSGLIVLGCTPINLNL